MLTPRRGRVCGCAPPCDPAPHGNELAVPYERPQLSLEAEAARVACLDELVEPRRAPVEGRPG